MFTLTTLHVFMAGPRSFHSDGALKSVLAAMALEQGALVPEGWVFANGDLLTVTPYTLLLPLQYFFGMGITTNLVSVWLAYALMMGAAGLLAARIRVATDAPASAVPLVLMLTGSTLGALALEFTVSQGAYSLSTAFALVLLTCIILPKGRWCAAVAFLLSFFLVSANPLRAIVMVVAPVLLAAVCHSAMPLGPSLALRLKARLLSPPILAMLAGAFVGTLWYELVWLPNVLNFDAAARVSAPSISSIVEAVRRFPLDGFLYFSIGDWQQMGPVSRFAQYLVWATAAMALAAPGWVLAFRPRDSVLSMLAWTSYGMLAAGLLPLLLTQGLYYGPMEWRYGVIGFTLCFTVLVIALGRHFPDWPRARYAALWILALASIGSALHWPYLGVSGNVESRGISTEERMSLIRLLEHHQVGTVGATYWNSHVLSVLSSGSVIANPILYADGVSPYPHHAPVEARHGSAGPRHAVVLQQDQFDLDQGESMRWQFGAPALELLEGPYRVWIYDQPVLDQAYGMGVRFDSPVAATDVRIAVAQSLDSICSSGSCVITVEIKNTGTAPLMSAGHLPLRLGLMGVDSNGVEADTGVRLDFQTPLEPGDSRELRARIPAIPGAVDSLRPCLMQENVAWLCERTDGNANAVKYDSAVYARSVGARIEVISPKCEPSKPCSVELSVLNTGQLSLSTQGKAPLRVGIQQITSDGTIVILDAGRVDFRPALGPGSKTTLRVVLEPLTAGASAYRYCLLQEGVAWLCDRTNLETVKLPASTP